MGPGDIPPALQRLMQARHAWGSTVAVQKPCFINVPTRSAITSRSTYSASVPRGAVQGLSPQLMHVLSHTCLATCAATNMLSDCRVIPWPASRPSCLHAHVLQPAFCSTCGCLSLCLLHQHLHFPHIKHTSSQTVMGTHTGQPNHAHALSCAAAVAGDSLIEAPDERERPQ